MLKKFRDWLILGGASAMIRLSIALYNTENDLLKPVGNGLTKVIGRFVPARIRSRLLEKFAQGQRDEQYVQDFYEILKKADKFMLNLTSEKAEIAAYKHGLSLGQKDKWGRRYDHYGFFDPKSKHYGKTLGEVFKEEVHERSVNDGKQVEIMFHNEPISEGFGDIDKVSNPLKQVLERKFPLKTVYNGQEEKKVVNRIEKLTEYLHVKRISEDYKILEFFIPAKFKLYLIEFDDKRVQELLDIKQIWFRDEYGGLYGYTVNGFLDMIEYGENKLKDNENDPDHLYDIIRLNATKIQNYE